MKKPDLLETLVKFLKRVKVKKIREVMTVIGPECNNDLAFLILNRKNPFTSLGILYEE